MIIAQITAATALTVGSLVALLSSTFGSDVILALLAFVS